MTTSVGDAEALRAFVERHRRLLVLSGAGCSTASGIPDYRDGDGNWKRSTRPVTLHDFLHDAATRRRYWARSVLGWRLFSSVQPNAAHYALAELERGGMIEALVTQNVDGLHQRSGSTTVIDLHGRLDRVRCLQCERRLSRAEFQQTLLSFNPHWETRQAQFAPDGDAELDGAELEQFVVPACTACGGLLKPDMVFFGESVPRERVERAMHHLHEADALLVVGSSLMLYSGYRFAQQATEQSKPIAAINLGRTRADDLLTIKLEQPCERALTLLLPQTSRAA